MAGSECSSGCESGWTHYLEKSSPSSRSISYEDYSGEGDGFRRIINGGGGEEEDLSMVSDASSGPPHLIDSGFNHECFYGAAAVLEMEAVDESAALGRSRGRRQRNREVKQRMLLDDTASSRPVLDYVKENDLASETIAKTQ